MQRQRNPRTTFLHTRTHVYIYIYIHNISTYIYIICTIFLGQQTWSCIVPVHKPFCSVAMDPKKRKTKTQRFDLFADQAYEREVHQQRFMDDDLEAGDRSIPVLLAFAALVYELRF